MEIDRAELVDIATVHIDPDLPAEERRAQYLAQIKNPYCFLCNGSVVRLRFDESGGELRERLKHYFISCKTE